MKRPGSLERRKDFGSERYQVHQNLQDVLAVVILLLCVAAWLLGVLSLIHMTRDLLQLLGRENPLA